MKEKSIKLVKLAMEVVVVVVGHHREKKGKKNRKKRKNKKKSWFKEQLHVSFSHTHNECLLVR